MTGDDVCSREKLVERDRRDAYARRELARNPWRVREDAHVQPARAVTDDATDVAEADHTEDLVGRLVSEERALFPPPGAHRALACAARGPWTDSGGTR